MITLKEFKQAVSVFANTVKKDFASNIEAQPEDQLKRTTCTLLEQFIDGKITTRTEAQIPGLGARPDIGVAFDTLLTGYVELKAPNISLKKLKGSNASQFLKFQSLPNLIYTNGNEWVLFRTGERVGKLIAFAGDIVEEGSSGLSDSNIEELYNLLLVFFSWEPIVPKNPKGLAEMLAPLCRFLRDYVEIATNKNNSSITFLYRDWQRLFFPEADQHRFSDAYAQTLTYALLLAKLSGAKVFDLEEAANSLDQGHSLLAQTLRLLCQEEAKLEMQTPVEVLQRVIGSIDIESIREKGDPWLYFYEDFLAVYDPKLRKDYGVYYTPIQVVECQVRLCNELLVTEFNKPLGFADEGVTFLDPATGTAAYPLTAMQFSIDAASKRFGEGIISSIATRMAENFYAFEFMVGPYAVSHMRLTKLLRDAGAKLPQNGIKVYLTDTLEDPNADAPRFSFAERELAEEHIRAQQVKRNTEILVCMGNPPYDREQREKSQIETGRRKGGWVRYGSGLTNINETDGILRDFIDGAPGVHVKNLYNDYVYFWRWALWKLYESESSMNCGIISFITASSYLRGPGFVSMRQRMRAAFEVLWIIDLEGDNIGARKTENVFNIQTPVAIAFGFRKRLTKSDEPAVVHYSKVSGTREQKLSILGKVNTLGDLQWHVCFKEWQQPFLPKTSGDYYSWPVITNIFPWQYSGAQFKRKWPISFDKEVLKRRWEKLVAADIDSKRSLFVESRDRTVILDYESKGDKISGGKKISSLHSNSRLPLIQRYAYRSFDRQYCIADNRVGDYLRPELWYCLSEQQVFFCSIFSKVLGAGAGMVATSLVPDLDFFCGRGGKDIIPMWKDAISTQPNVTNGILEILSTQYGIDVQVELLFQYCYAVVANPYYTRTFSEELTVPGPLIPITKEKGLFLELANLGKKLIYYHTFGERFNDGVSGIPEGMARCTRSIPVTEAEYPEAFSYDESTKVLRIGKGEIACVKKQIFEFSVSDWKVVKKWLLCRMKDGSGKSSSLLDDIRPLIWSAAMTQELLELLWVLEYTIGQHSKIEVLLDQVIKSDCFNADDFPQPSDAEKKPSKSVRTLI